MVEASDQSSRDATHTPQRVSPHSAGNRFARVLWAVVYRVLFRPSPRPCHRWRNWLLRRFGASMHPTARVYSTAKVWAPWNLHMEENACVADDVDVYCVSTISIGAHSTVSQYSYLCGATHDCDDVEHPLVPKPITLGRRVWIAADVFVAPGVSIGDGAVIGARSGVFSDLEPWHIYAGTPARTIRKRRIGPADFGEAVSQP